MALAELTCASFYTGIKTLTTPAEEKISNKNTDEVLSRPPGNYTADVERFFQPVVTVHRLRMDSGWTILNR